MEVCHSQIFPHDVTKNVGNFIEYKYFFRSKVYHCLLISFKPFVGKQLVPKIFASNFNCSHLVTFVGMIEYILPTLPATACNFEYFFSCHTLMIVHIEFSDFSNQSHYC